VLGEKIDLFGAHEVGGEDEIALVFAALVVHQHDDVAAPDLFDDLLDRGQLRRLPGRRGDG
jgi:hypothetical protein